MAFALGLALATAADSPVRQIEVRQTEEGYAVDLAMWVPAPRRLAFEVLTDFEHMADWVPNVQTSRVLKREANRATVEYQGLMPFGFLALPFTTVREIEFVAPVSIRATQIGGTMKRHESLITLHEEGSGTRLDYRVDMVPGGLASVVMSQRRIEKEFTEHFDAIAAEIRRRNEAELSPPR